VFDYDWFHGRQFQEQCDDAKMRCALRRYPELDPEAACENEEFKAFLNELRVRTLVYLRDGFSYEFKSFANVESKAHLTFECEPVDDQYKVGAFVISVPFEDIVRVEIFAVPPDEMPIELPPITGFRGRSEPPSS
jgi:hypothetical protein